MAARIFTDVVFVRHGETDGNNAGLLQGRGNSHLSENGIRQAKAAADALSDVPFTAAYSSDLIRAVETSRILLEKHPGVPLIATPELEEWNVGIYEGRKQAELLTEIPDIMNRFRFEGGDFDVPGGESRQEFQSRVSGCLNRAVREHRGGCVLIVAHGWTAHRILAHFYGNPKNGMALPVPYNTGISRFRWYNDENTCQMISWNETGHLRGIPMRSNPVDR